MDRHFQSGATRSFGAANPLLSIADKVGSFQPSDRDRLLHELDDFQARFRDMLDAAFSGRFKVRVQ